MVTEKLFTNGNDYLITETETSYCLIVIKVYKSNKQSDKLALVKEFGINSYQQLDDASEEIKSILQGYKEI